MTKTTKTAALLSTDVQAPAAPTETSIAPASITLLPPTLRLIGPTLTVLSEMIVHARLGYVLDTDAPVDQFAQAGTMSLFLRLGTPDAGVVKIAQATVEAAAAQQRLQYARDVKEAARQIVEDEARKVKEAEVAARVAATQAEIKALQASLTTV